MIGRYERVPVPAAGLRLHLNENTAGCSPAVREALQAVTRQQAACYPDYDAAQRACAARFGVPPECLQLTNGLDEGILAVSVAAFRGGGRTDGRAIIVVPAFDMYAICAGAAGGAIDEIPLGAEFNFPLEAVLRAISPDIRLIFLTNPNNPTGRPIPREAILTVARHATGALVFVDEAYADFSGETLLGAPELAALPNVVLGRTFSKAYGLAGIRVGAIVGSPDTLEPIRRVVPPYSLNVYATVGVCAALADLEYYEWYLDQVSASKALLYEGLDRLGVRYWRSAANFVLADFGPEARRVIAALAARQIYVRDRRIDPACPGCVRITTGIVEHTRPLVAALEEVL
ncbi:MAG TPA: histidinol-phosphate transaminase [Vicinamibacterales bacterium]|nr:histidinol-phosphate transaminase [Vicinamibacterales bacterium]